MTGNGNVFIDSEPSISCEITIDGPIIGDPANDTLNTLIFDAFGNSYTAAQLATVPNTHGGGHCLAGTHFQIDFFGNGFNTHADAAAMRNIICLVFADIEQLLVFGNCVGGNTIVNIRVLDSGAPSGVLASASPFYTLGSSNENNGIIDNDVWKAVNTGDNDANVYDAQLNVNFDLSFINATWNYDLNTATTLTQMDAYSVMLHEALHALGFNSLIAGDGTSLAPASDHYSRWDRFIQGATGFITQPACNNAVFSGAVADITAGCANVMFNGTGTLDFPQQPVSAPDPYALGTSLSHFVINCEGTATPPYVMNPGLAQGDERRAPTPAEVATFCDLGYQTT